MPNALVDLWHSFGVALMPGNLLWCLVGAVFGNMVGVLPGMGVMAAISLLLPLTFGMPPVAAILMLAGIYYGAQYGGAICSILLNLPCHPLHAVTCLDGFPMTKQGRGGAALGITMLPPSWAHRSGSESWSCMELHDGIEIVALALGLFGIAEFFKSVNRIAPIEARYTKVTLKDLRPSREDLRRSFPAMLRGTLAGALCSLIPGTGPTIASFVAYAAEKRLFRNPELSARLARAWNDSASEAHRQYPERLFALIALPMMDIDRSIAELDRAKALPGMRGVHMGTNVAAKDLSDKRFLPIFKAIEAADLPVFLHPVQTVGGDRTRPFFLGNLIGNPVETGLTAAHLIMGGVLDACPKLEVNLPHDQGCSTL